MEHFIFTNFGVGIKDFSWLTYRFELFSKVCTNALKNQSITGFRWIVFIDVDLPHVIKNRIIETLSSCAFFAEVIEVNKYSDIQGAIQSYISCNSTAEHLLTSRIDDDDALANNAIELIQSAALDSICSGKNNSVISIQCGYEWLPGDNLYRYVKHETLALGLSLISRKTHSGYNVNQFAHHLIVETLTKHDPETGFYKIFENKPGYLYTKHSLSDSYFTGSRARIIRDPATSECNPDYLRDLFGILPETIECLKESFSKSPMGMPYKYLALSAEISKAIKDGDDISENERLHVGLNAFKLNWMQTHATKKFIRKGRKIKLAIIGSCVSRDLFTHLPNFGDDFELVAYVARQNLASYVSTPSIDQTLSLKMQGSGFEEKRAVWDLNKTHWQVLEAAQPDIILIDFIDERIGGIFNEGSIHTASGPMIKTFERRGKEFVIERPWGAKMSSLRAWSAREFMNRVFSICDNIIIHKASWATEYKNKNGDIVLFKDSEFSKLVELNNKVLDDVFSGLSSSGIPYEVVGGGSLMRGGGNHLWSFCPYHYDYSYYKNLGKEIAWRV